MLLALIVALTVNAASSHPTHHTHSLIKRTSYPNGIATFNNFVAQGNTNCGPSSGQNGAYGAAASDISPGISGGTCPGSVLMSNCAGQNVIAGYQAPGCPKSNCGKCYKVTNNGGIGGSIGGVGNQITVQIIDACPASSAYNYCKTNMPANQRCSDAGTNQLDIDQSAYMALTGQAYGGGPNLNIGIEDADCSGAPSGGDSTQSSAVPSSSSDLSLGAPGQHAAGGDKMAKHVMGGNLAVQALGSPGQISSVSSSTAAVPTPPPPAAVPSSIQPTTTSDGSPEDSNQATAVDDEECDEL